jgi:outer membrane protein assembly factor BamB
MVSALNFADATARTMYVLNPADGSLRWKRDVYGGDYRFAFDSGLVLVSPNNAVIRGLDWRTGNEMWTLADPVNKYGPVRTHTYQVATARDTGGPADLTGAPYNPDLTGDRRLVQLDSDKTLRVIDAQTGKVLRERKAVAGSDDLALAHDGRLDVVVRQTGYEIREYDLDNLGEPQVVYSQPDTARMPLALQRCGSDRLCVLDRGTDPQSTEVVGIDVKGRKARWHGPAVGTEELVAAGDRVLATTVDGEPASALFDTNGKQLLPEDARKSVGVRVNALSVLLFSATPSTYPADVSLTGVAATDGTRQPLGSLSKVRSRSCSWNEHVLVCAAEQEFRVWRFAS